MTPERTLYEERRRRSFNDMLRQHKLACGCTDCGYAVHAEALDFDHVHAAKLFEISRAANRRWGAVWREISKCEVVCANCHRHRTLIRR